jgi:hypothetical protein
MEGIGYTRYALHLSDDGKTYMKIAEGQWAENADRKSVHSDSDSTRWLKEKRLGLRLGLRL